MRLIPRWLSERISYILFSPLQVVDIGEDSILLNTGKTLFGAKLNSGKEYIECISKDVFERIRISAKTASTYLKDPNNFLFIVYYKTKVGSIYDMDIFFFSFKKDLLEEVAKDVPLRFLNGWELTNTLLKVQTLSNDFTALVDKKIVSGVDIFKEYFVYKEKYGKLFRWDALFHSPIGSLYKRLLLDKLSTGEITYFSAATPHETEVVDLEKLIERDWEGALWVVINLNNIEHLLQQRYKFVDLKYKKIYKEGLDKYKEDENPLVGLYILYACRDCKEAENIFKLLAFQPVKINYKLGEYVFRTPLAVRDPDYEQIKSSDYAIKLIPKNIRKFIKHKEPIVYGWDRFGIYVNYNNFDREYISSYHIGLFGPTRSGKSFWIQNFMKEALDIDLEALLEGNHFRGIGNKNLRIRYFDKGYSAEFLFKLLKLRGEEVVLFSTSPDEMLYNPFDVDIENFEEEAEFAIALVDAVLQIHHTRLEGTEPEVLKWVLHTALKNPGARKIARIYKVEQLKDEYPSLYNVLTKAGYRGDTTLYEIAKSDSRFVQFLYPVAGDLINIIELAKNKRGITETRKKILDGLQEKLTILQGTPFGFFSLLNLKTARLFYMDIDSLMGSKYFTPFMSAIMKKLFDYDKYNKPEGEKAYYVFDEVHTLFAIPAFEKLLNVLTREVAKFKISLIYATQEIVNIPKQVLNNIATHILLSRGEDMQGPVESYIDHVGLDPKEGKILKELVLKTKRYSAVFRTAGQLFTFHLPVDPYKLKLFDSERFILPTSDGYLITKRAVSKADLKKYAAKGYKIV